MNATWKKTTAGRYEATINGRRFVLVCNRKTRTWTVCNPQFVCIGRKPRVSSTTTWYNVYEEVGGEMVDRTWQSGGVPGSLDEAKATAALSAKP